MSQVMQDVGPFTLSVQRDRFLMLVRSILSQQISVGAARTIRQRLIDLVSPEKISPEVLIRLNLEQMRSVGISRQKATYLIDLTTKVLDATVELKSMGRRSDDQVIEKLTQVKGIGVWTAQMFLIFSLGRLNVFPVDDLGVQRAIQHRYGFKDKPNRQQCLEIAAPWHPFCSVASWYCWRSLDT